MRSRFDDRALVEHHDAIRTAHRTQPVCDDKGGTPLQCLVEGSLQCSLVFVVEMARRLVENHDRRVLQQQPGDREPLLFTTRHAVSALTHDRAETVGKRVDGVHDAGRPTRCAQFVVGGVGFRIAEVVADRFVEEMRVLRDDGDRRPQ